MPSIKKKNILTSEIYDNENENEDGGAVNY